MYLTTKGLVLRVTAYNDTDALLTILTPENGKLTAKARGLRRKNSPLAAPCQLLAYAEFTLYENRGNYTINEAHSVELFHPLRSDLQKLSLGTYFAQAADILSQADSPNSELLSLVLNCLYALSKLDISEAQVKSVFEMRIACLAGYAPALDGCYRCGNPQPDRFDISQGLLECSRCRDHTSAGIRMPLNATVLDAMRYICSCDSKRIFLFQTPPEAMEQLTQITETYLTTQLERGFSALDFYKTILNT